jgi:hypothetical protein
MTILAFGCSVTHGAELVHPDQHEDNTKFSYPNLIADALGTDCLNLATCGISNEQIFHNVVGACDMVKHIKIDAVIVGWTSTIREYWQADGRTWQFIPSWCATTATGKFNHFKDYADKNIDLYPRLCADEEQYLEPLSKMYEYLTRYKFDINEYETKKQNYISSVRRYCNQRSYKLIETCCLGDVEDIQFKLDTFGTWRQGIGHPTREDHKQIAQQILLTL